MPVLSESPRPTAIAGRQAVREAGLDRQGPESAWSVHRHFGMRTQLHPRRQRIHINIGRRRRILHLSLVLRGSKAPWLSNHPAILACNVDPDPIFPLSALPTPSTAAISHLNIDTNNKATIWPLLPTTSSSSSA